MQISKSNPDDTFEVFLLGKSWGPSGNLILGSLTTLNISQRRLPLRTLPCHMMTYRHIWPVTRTRRWRQISLWTVWVQQVFHLRSPRVLRWECLERLRQHRRRKNPESRRQARVLPILHRSRHRHQPRQTLPHRQTHQVIKLQALRGIPGPVMSHPLVAVAAAVAAAPGMTRTRICMDSPLWIPARYELVLVGGMALASFLSSPPLSPAFPPLPCLGVSRFERTSNSLASSTHCDAEI